MTQYPIPYTPVEETRRHSETTTQVEALQKSLGNLGQMALSHILQGWDEYEPPRKVEERMNSA